MQGRATFNSFVLVDVYYFLGWACGGVLWAHAGPRPPTRGSEWEHAVPVPVADSLALSAYILAPHARRGR